jgi:hypothetical protein
MRGKCDASGALFVGLRYAQALAEPRLDGNDDGARISIVKCKGQSFALKFLPARYKNSPVKTAQMADAAPLARHSPYFES